MAVNTTSVQQRIESKLSAILPLERLGSMQTRMETGRFTPQAEPSYRWDVKGDLSGAEIAALEAAGFSVTNWEADGYEPTSPTAPRFSIGGPEGD